MSVDLMRLCWRVEFPSPAMSAVAVKLADCANDEGENVYPSVGRIERETRLGAATVRRVLSAFEQAGLLEVVAEASGNKWGRSTTIRRFDLGLLHDLSAVEVRRHGRVLLAPSTHVLKQVRDPAACEVETERRRKAEQRRAEGKPERAMKDTVVCDCCPWAIVARGADDPSDYAREDVAPLPEREGQNGPAPPGAGGDPSRSGSPTPPGAGANPSIEPPVESPPTPPKGGASEDFPDHGRQDDATRGVGGRGTKGGWAKGARGFVDDDRAGWARGWTFAAQQEVAELRAAGHPAAVFIDLVRGTRRPQKGADALAFVRELAECLAGVSAEVAAETARRMRDARSAVLPSAPEIGRAAAAIAAERERDTEEEASRSAIVTDPVLAARWPELRAELVRRLGEAVVAGWYGTCVPHRLAGGCLVLAVDVPFRAKWIGQHHAAALLEAAQAVLGLVSRVDVTWQSRVAA